MNVEKSKPQFGNKGHKWCQWVAAKKWFCYQIQLLCRKITEFFYIHTLQNMGLTVPKILVRTIHALFGLTGRLR